MRDHFMPRGGCRCRSRLEKSAIAAPILDGITDVHAQGSTIARVHPEIRRISRSHLAVMHALGVSSSLLMCPRDPLSRCRSRSHLTVVRNSRGCSVCTSRRRCHARAPPPLEIRRRDRCHLAVVHTLWARRRVHALEIRCRSRSHLAVVHASGGLRRALASGIRRRERVPRIPRRARLSEVGA